MTYLRVSPLPKKIFPKLKIRLVNVCGSLSSHAGERTSAWLSERSSVALSILAHSGLTQLTHAGWRDDRMEESEAPSGEGMNLKARTDIGRGLG